MTTDPTPVRPLTSTPLKAANVATIRLDGGFWGERQELNREVTIPHSFAWLEKAGTLRNFDAAAQGFVGQERRGREFDDSNAYKVLEAAVWECSRERSEHIEHLISETMQRILPAVLPDGYVNTNFGHKGQEPRYTDFEWGHELYNYGHLIQAAVARIRAGFSIADPLVGLGLRVADHVVANFDQNGMDAICGHPEIEVALVELFRATKDERYLEQADLFLKRRGHQSLPDIEFGREYFQDDVPIEDAQVLRGHAVRATYLTAAAVDVAVEQANDELLRHLEQQYKRTLATRTYLTGGMGSHHQDEAFGSDFELPPERAYCETCAGIGSIMVAWRLLLATGDLRYGDIIERTLYNVVATGLGRGGDTFFYANPLHQAVITEESDPDAINPRASSLGRAPWFVVACCPANISRTVAQLASYVATYNEKGVQLIQFMPSQIDLEIRQGEHVKLRVDTHYPQSSKVKVSIDQAPEDWTLTFRIPDWAQGAKVTRGGTTSAAVGATIEISGLQAGEEVVLDLGIEPRITYPDPRIDAVRGCVAVERGPLVYCMESVDQVDAADVSQFAVFDREPWDGELRDNEVLVIMEGIQYRHEEPQGWPYRNKKPVVSASPALIQLIPYYSWANRGPSTMRIWLPVVNSKE